MVNEPRSPEPQEPAGATTPAAATPAAATPAAASTPAAAVGRLVRWVRDGRGAFLLVALLLGAAVVADDPVPLGAARLAALVIMVSGASLLVTRMSAADLATASAAAAGAYLGGVGTALLGWPVLAGIPVGAAAGAGVGAVSGALHGRVGRTLGALTSLALAGGVLATVGAWTQGGGVAGFHAVRLIARGGARTELVVIAVVTLLALVAARAVASSRIAAAAAVAVRAPVLAASLGRHPAVDSAIVGAAAGALLGAGGTVLAAVDGSVVPAAYGLQLAAALALAALLGGAPPLGALIGTLLVWGPSTVWPLVPLVGTAPPLLVAGPVGLLVLALRRGRPLIGRPSHVAPGHAPPDHAAPGHVAPGHAAPGHAAPGHAAPDHVAPGPRAPAHAVTLQVRGAQTPSGPIDLDVRAGEVVALAGPNGAGKSTLLARIAGQLPDGGAVSLVAGPAAGGAVTGRGEEAPPAERAPHGAVGRARAGIRRTWQRPPDVDATDLAVLTHHDPGGAEAVAWAAATLAADATDPSVQQLLLLAASAPGIALLDEPTEVDAARLNVLLRGLAQAGSGVLVVDHRPEVLAAADRVVGLGAEVSST